MFKDKVLKYNKRNKLFHRGDRIVVGVSGGKDSVYLLRRLLDLAPERDLTVQAAHLNHRLRGAESDRDEAFVRAFCTGHGPLLCRKRKSKARREGLGSRRQRRKVSIFTVVESGCENRYGAYGG